MSRGIGSGDDDASSSRHAKMMSARQEPMWVKQVKVEIRDKSAAAPPSPIPNLAVKRCSAEGTASSRGWETRPSRVSLFLGNGALVYSTRAFFIALRDPPTPLVVAVS